jgi:hypothetical protein
MEADRYDRQWRLREVGPAGQLRIERSEAVIAAGPQASTELSYLLRAGVERAAIVNGRAGTCAHAEFFQFSGPRAVASGAEGALRHLLSCLELP